jgi:hypothetical protein
MIMKCALRNKCRITAIWALSDVNVTEEVYSAKFGGLLKETDQIRSTKSKTVSLIIVAPLTKVRLDFPDVLVLYLHKEAA